MGTHKERHNCFAQAAKDQCTATDLAAIKAKPITAMDDKFPASITTACFACSYNAVYQNMEACRKSSSQCGKMDKVGNRLSDDAACVRCKQAALDDVSVACGPASMVDVTLVITAGTQFGVELIEVTSGPIVTGRNRTRAMAVADVNG